MSRTRASSMVVAMSAASAIALATCGRESARPAPVSPLGSSGPALSLSALLSDAPGARGRTADDGYERALTPRPFVFPDDDGPHAAFRSEWWYFTGVLRARDAALPGGRRFGYEMTIFRQALAPQVTARASAWATRDVFMGHFAITDVDGAGAAASSDRRFHAHERFARDGLDLAGARAQPFAVWIDEWRMEGPARGGESLPVHLSAHDDDGATIDLDVGLLDVSGAAQPIAEGDRGLSVKGPTPGNASFYYSRTSLATRGRLTLPRAGGAPAGGDTFEVTGRSWMDREWSTGALGAGVHGWDWLGVHLSDGRDLMMYRLRDADERATNDSRVALISVAGATRQRDVRSYSADRFTLVPIETWTSPHSGARYPVSFRLEIPDERISLVVRPLLADQELRLSLVYWEGAVSLAGVADGGAITGEGYLELTGYGGGQRQR